QSDQFSWPLPPHTSLRNREPRRRVSNRSENATSRSRQRRPTSQIRDFIQRYLGLSGNHQSAIASQRNHASSSYGMTVQGGDNWLGVKKQIRVEICEADYKIGESFFGILNKFRNIEAK